MKKINIGIILFLGLVATASAVIIPEPIRFGTNTNTDIIGWDNYYEIPTIVGLTYGLNTGYPLSSVVMGCQNTLKDPDGTLRLNWTGMCMQTMYLTPDKAGVWIYDSVKYGQTTCQQFAPLNPPITTCVNKTVTEVQRKYVCGYQKVQEPYYVKIGYSRRVYYRTVTKYVCGYQNVNVEVVKPYCTTQTQYCIKSTTPIVYHQINSLNPTLCGNGVLEGKEIRDENGAIISPYKGNEICDDGNIINGDGCNKYCTPEFCGNNIVDYGEECDGTSSLKPGCKSDCTFNKCGDGIQSPWEMCDDGNNVDGDGCNNLCQVEA